jgi:dephospho-CoA kinase
MIRIGITGPIGCGKSTVAGWLGELGAAVIDADDVAREVTAEGTPAAEAIAAEFGTQILRADGSLDRAALGRIVFADADALARLEGIVHPAVRPVILERMEQAATDGALAVVVEAIKLVEGGLAALCDEVWLVTCDAGEQLERLLARGTIAADDAQARIAAQAGLAERLAPAATRVIDTSGPAAAAAKLVEAAWFAALEGYGGGKVR